MNKSFKLISTTTLFLMAAQQNCLATDFDPLVPPASSVSASGGDNSAALILAIRNSNELSEVSRHVNVTCKDGAMIISGTVTSDRDRQQISAIAQQNGCTDVRNEVTVAGATSVKPIHQGEVITVQSIKKHR